jgi:ubiquinone/menaquinone biosynthesis C-methylase UbiE
MTENLSVVSKDHPAYAGQAVYTPSFLRIYDQFVLGFSMRFIYRCPSTRLLELYNRHAGRRHLDLGPGTGYFLDRCRWPVGDPQLTLVDLNPHVLRHSAKRLRRFGPTLVQADILRPLPLPDKAFDSVGINFLLHCVPGAMREKAVVFHEAARVLDKGGVLFGSTVVQDGGDHGRLARRAMRTYNRHGILCTDDDHLPELRAGLAAAFDQYDVEVRGSVAVFVARR